MLVIPTFDGNLNVNNVVGVEEAEVKCARWCDPQSRELFLLHKPRQSCISPLLTEGNSRLQKIMHALKNVSRPNLSPLNVCTRRCYPAVNRLRAVFGAPFFSPVVGAAGSGGGTARRPRSDSLRAAEGRDEAPLSPGKRLLLHDATDRRLHTHVANRVRFTLHDLMSSKFRITFSHCLKVFRLLFICKLLKRRILI